MLLCDLRKKKKSSLPSHRGNPLDAVQMSASAKCKTNESQQMDIYVDGWIVHLICNHLIKAFVSIFIFVSDVCFLYSNIPMACFIQKVYQFS